MKHILSILAGVLLLASTASAQTRAVATQTLMGLGMPAELASAVAGLSTGLGVLSNNTYLLARNAAGTANLNLIKADASNNTVVNATASKQLILQLADDPQRLINFSAASDTSDIMTWGDGGVTATQQLSILASTADADDDSVLVIAAGHAANSSGGAYLQMYGNENGGAGALAVGAGGTASITLETGGAAKFTIDNTGQLIGAGTATIGWVVKAGANTACTTTCVTPCVFGQESTSKDILACSDATADLCVCAGAS